MLNHALSFPDLLDAETGVSYVRRTLSQHLTSPFFFLCFLANDSFLMNSWIPCFGSHVDFCLEIFSYLKISIQGVRRKDPCVLCKTQAPSASYTPVYYFAINNLKSFFLGMFAWFMMYAKFLSILSGLLFSFMIHDPKCMPCFYEPVFSTLDVEIPASYVRCRGFQCLTPYACINPDLMPTSCF